VCIVRNAAAAGSFSLRAKSGPKTRNSADISKVKFRQPDRQFETSLGPPIFEACSGGPVLRHGAAEKLAIRAAFLTQFSRNWGGQNRSANWRTEALQFSGGQFRSPVVAVVEDGLLHSSFARLASKLIY